jgi:hypothetical protein
MAVKASYCVGLNSAHAAHAPYMYILRNTVSPHPFSVLSLFLFVVLEISRKIQMCSINLPHSTPFHWGDSWLRSWPCDKVSYSQLRQRVPYTMFFFDYREKFGKLRTWISKKKYFLLPSKMAQYLPPPPPTSWYGQSIHLLHREKKAKKRGGREVTLTTMLAALQRHCTENSKQIFPEMKLRGCTVSFLGKHKLDLLCSVIWR